MPDQPSQSLIDALMDMHDRYIKPLGSAYPREQPQWAKDNPNMARFIGEGLPLALMGIRAAPGATMGNDAVMAHRLGEHEAPTVTMRLRDALTPETFVNSADPIFRGAKSGNFYYGPDKPTNMNKPLQIESNPYLDALLGKQWDQMVKAGRKPDLTIIKGDKP
jgi:hypothetical protein